MSNKISGIKKTAVHGGFGWFGRAMEDNVFPVFGRVIMDYGLSELYIKKSDWSNEE